MSKLKNKFYGVESDMQVGYPENKCRAIMLATVEEGFGVGTLNMRIPGIEILELPDGRRRVILSCGEYCLKTINPETAGFREVEIRGCKHQTPFSL